MPASSGSQSPAEPAQPSWPSPEDGIAGAEAAAVVLARPEVYAESAHVAESGDVLVKWSLQESDRDMSHCASPAVLALLPHHAYRQGLDRSAVRTWLISAGVREITSTARGFYLSLADCTPGRSTPARAFVDRPQALEPLVVDARGARHVVVRDGPTLSFPGTVAVSCGLFLGSRTCQLDPRRRILRPLHKYWFWDRTWHEGTSLLTNKYGYITKTWSSDEDRTWFKPLDTWDVASLRVGDDLWLADNGRGATYLRRVYLPCAPYAPDCAPEDTTVVAKLPTSPDRYRSWQTLTSGVLFGTGSRGAFYVSDGTNWGRIVRRSAPQKLIDGSSEVGALGDLVVLVGKRHVGVSQDLGITWSHVAVQDVRPR